MMTRIQSVPILSTRPRLLRTVAIVSRQPQPEVVDAMLDGVHPDVVFVESIAHAYSQIKRVTPDLVIVCLSSDDVDACRVLSMLRLDSETCRIPVLTCVTAPADGSGVRDSSIFQA
jgi:CheY-like chemotaxis protein